MHIIVNPASGKGAALRCLSAVTSYLTSRNIDYTIHKTNGRGHGKQLAESLCAATSGEPVVALGGDGTFHEVLNGMDFSRCRMGFIPAGRGNDYAAGVASITFNPIAAVAAIVRGEPAESDYIQVGNLRCLNICGTGLDVDVLELTERSHNALSYVVALAHCLLHYEPYTVQVAVNGTEREYACIMLGICNGSQFGGGIRLCPVARHDDGVLDVIIMSQPKPYPALFIMPGFVKGKHMGKWYTTHITCERIRVATPQKIELDGEIYDTHVLDARVVPRGLKTFCSTAAG